MAAMRTPLLVTVLNQTDVSVFNDRNQASESILPRNPQGVLNYDSPPNAHPGHPEPKAKDLARSSARYFHRTTNDQTLVRLPIREGIADMRIPAQTLNRIWMMSPSRIT